MDSDSHAILGALVVASPSVASERAEYRVSPTGSEHNLPPVTFSVEVGIARTQDYLTVDQARALAAELNAVAADAERAAFVPANCPCQEPSPLGSPPCTYERPCIYAQGRLDEARAGPGDWVAANRVA